MLFLVAPSSTSRLRLQVANWSVSHQLGFSNLFITVYTGPEKPQWGVANYVYIYFYLLSLSALSIT